MRDHQHAVVLRQLRQRLLHAIAGFDRREGAIVGAELARRRVRPRRRIQRLVGRAVGSRLNADVLDDPEDPRGQPRFTAEVRNAAVHLQEDVLRQIRGLAAIGHHPVDEAEDQILVPIDELGERGVVAGAAPLDELSVVDLHPTASIRFRRSVNRFTPVLPA